jgi:hypothetical protein
MNKPLWFLTAEYKVFKLVQLIPIVGIFTSCVHSSAPFIEDGIRIVPPVKQKWPEPGANAKKGAWIVDTYDDGGTKMFTIIDAEGKAFDVYIDHRAKKKEVGGTVYLNAYPDKPGSIRLKDQKGFKDRILNGLPKICTD